MNNDYLNEEMEIDLLELLKCLLKNSKKILNLHICMWFSYVCIIGIYFAKKLLFKYRYYNCSCRRANGLYFLFSWG